MESKIFGKNLTIMSELRNHLIKAYELTLEGRNRGLQREIHSLIRRRFPDRLTLQKLREAKRKARPNNSTAAHEEIIPNFKGKKVIPAQVEGKPKLKTPDELNSTQIKELIEKGEDATIDEFGSIEAFKAYLEERFEDIDFGRKQAFSSLSKVFLDYLGEDEEVEEVNIFD